MPNQTDSPMGHRGRRPDQDIRLDEGSGQGRPAGRTRAGASRCSARNGAGKTTMVRILSTLLPPDAGRARVAGFDIIRDRHQVRRSISLTGQYAALDPLLTGAENLRMMARLSGLRGTAAGRRADELLARFGLTGAARRRVATYSGGMRRRLRPGRQPGRPPGGDLPRRADDRPGPAQPPGDVAGHRGPGRVRGDRLPDHPVPGGGGPAGRAGRGPGRRPHRGRRDHRENSRTGSPGSAWT